MGFLCILGFGFVCARFFGHILFAVTFFNYFTSKVSTYTREIETAANILFETFDEMDRMSGTGGSGSSS